MMQLQEVHRIQEAEHLEVQIRDDHEKMASEHMVLQRIEGLHEVTSLRYAVTGIYSVNGMEWNGMEWLWQIK